MAEIKISDDEEIRRAIGGVLVGLSNTLDDIDDLTQWHPCEPTCSRKCGCSGIPYVSDALWEQLKPILAGRLLPPGGEVTEETEWAVQHKLDDGNVNTSNPFYRREHAEWRTWSFHFGQQEPGVVVRRRIWAGPWSPVASDNSEGESGG